MGRDENLEETSLFDTYFLALAGFFVGARAGYVVLNLSDFENIYRVLGFVAFPGLSFLSGGVVAIGVVILLANSYDWEIWKVLDNFAASLGIVLVFGSVASLLSRGLLIIEIMTFVWAVFYFVIINRVRKNFRFYQWYRNDRSVAPEGLASYLAIGFVGLWLILRGILEDSWRFYGVSYYIVLGVVVVLGACLLIYWRSGRALLKNKER
mgnify:CR=1 FL=1